MEPVPAAAGEGSGTSTSSSSVTPSLLLSPTERQFLVDGIHCDIRNDGRSRLDYRFFQLTTAAVPHASGSARIRLDGTDILVAVTLDITPVNPERPTQGIALCEVEFAASAALSSSSSSAVTAIRLADALQGLLVRSGALDLAQLCILPHSQCWTLYLDAVILSAKGNLLSALSLAALAALLTTSIPSLSVVPSASPGTPPEISITDDPPTPLHTQQLPIAVSVWGFGGDVLLDATEEEEEGADWVVQVGVDGQGEVVWMKKGGRGGVKVSVMKEVLRIGKKVGKEMSAMVRKMVAAQQTKMDHT